MKNRRKSRELALQALYACEVGDQRDAAAVKALFDHLSEENGCEAEVRAYAQSLVDHALAHQDAIDALIQQHSANWELRRMAATDRNVLRMAVSELQSSTDVPYKVVIDECIELAKAYGTDDSGKFVNGVIDSIRKKLMSGAAAR